MEIPFACTFKGLLASEDNTNYASYLLNFFLARYKACREVEEMAEVRLNCLVIPDNIQADKITHQHLLTIDIGTKESVHSLRSKINGHSNHRIRGPCG
ncbi:hypothetical protein C1646_760596 [Rhizophagus diaphanus]|nr:hypothetical protein C1646_760596 [Rhizophagus diaphanus] [Rhizophagus sp. MUCL 43196]